mgnify:CR=1 FL=1
MNTRLRFWFGLGAALLTALLAMVFAPSGIGWAGGLEQTIPTIPTTVPTIPTQQPQPPPRPVVDDPARPGAVLPRTGWGSLPLAGGADEARVSANPLARIDPLRRLRINTLGIDSAVLPVPFTGGEWDVSRLGLAAGWLETSAHPLETGNTVLAGHLNLLGYGAAPFQKLAQLSDGALIQLYTERMLYTYQVRGARLVAENDLSALAPMSAPRLTLLTCANWNALRQDYTHRLVVNAELVQQQSLTLPDIRLRKLYFYLE